VKEIWVDVYGHTRYLVSNLGRVYSDYWKIYKKTSTDKDGYVLVSLNNKTKRRARVVLSSFNPIEGMDKLQVNHVNSIRNDDRLENLEWCTVSENHKHAYKTNGKEATRMKGSTNHNSKLTEGDVREIFKLLEDGSLKQKTIAEIYQVTPTTINYIKLGKSWQHVDRNEK